MEEGQREWAWKQGLEVLGLSQHLMVAVRTREQAVKGEQWMDLKYILEIESARLHGFQSWKDSLRAVTHWLSTP